MDNKTESKVIVAKIRMLRWMYGVTKRIEQEINLLGFKGSVRMLRSLSTENERE